MIYARSNGQTVTFGATALAITVTLLIWGAVLAVIGYHLLGATLGLLGAVALAVVARTVLRLRHWPASRLGLFRDRLVLLHGGQELHVPWADVTTATLADQGDWAAGRWPNLRLTERLTIRLPKGAYSFRPASFGLDPAACRDLILRLRDEPATRVRLPEFDSVLDLTSRPVQSGQLLRPTL